MKATELFLKDGRPTGIWFCEKCRIVAPTQDIAERCCGNYECRECGQDTGSRTWLVCDDCRAKEEARKESERFEKAEKLTQWSGWVYDGSNYYESIADMEDDYDGRELPEYVWACKANHFVNADVSDITERMADNAYEDWDPETLDGLDELWAALDRFNEQNKDVCSYYPDYTKAVLIKEKHNDN